MKKTLCLALLLLPLWLAAQELPFAVKARTRYSASGLVGYVDIESQRYYQTQLIQEFRLWKLGMGVDLDFLFDKHYHLRKEDWDHAADILDKIYYVKYAQKGDPFYFHVGGFPGLTVGYGLVMQNYSNMLLYPEIRNIGAMVGGSPRWPLNPSFEIFTSDIRKNEILAFTARCRPLPDSTLSILDELTVGVSVVADRNQYANLKRLEGLSASSEFEELPADPATIIGLAYTLPIIQTEKFQIGQYAEFAHIAGYGSGAILPGFYAQIGHLKFNVEYRIYGSRFTPAFFNHDYEEERAYQPDGEAAKYITKEDAIKDFKPAQGFNGSVQAYLFHRVKAQFNWQNMVGPELQTGRSIGMKVWVDTQYKRLENVSLSYSKNNTNSLAIVHVNQPNASVSATLTFRVSTKRWFLIAKYSESYKDRNGDGHVDWARETKRNGSMGLKYIY